MRRSALQLNGAIVRSKARAYRRGWDCAFRCFGRFSQWLMLQLSSNCGGVIHGLLKVN